MFTFDHILRGNLEHFGLWSVLLEDMGKLEIVVRCRFGTVELEPWPVVVRVSRWPRNLHLQHFIRAAIIALADPVRFDACVCSDMCHSLRSVMSRLAFVRCFSASVSSWESEVMEIVYLHNHHVTKEFASRKTSKGTIICNFGESLFIHMYGWRNY